MKPETHAPKNRITKVEVIGAAWSAGQKRGGTEKSPNELREAGLLNSLKRNLNLNIIDHGDISIPTDKHFEYQKQHDLDNYGELGHLLGRLSETIAKTDKDSFTMVLGGDHSLGCGSVHGSLLKHGDDLRVIWIDAHADINTVQTSITKNYHGMPVAHIMDIFGVPLTGFEWKTKKLNPRNIVFIGIRDLDEAEKEIIHAHKIRAYSPYDVERMGGIQKVFDEAIDYLDLRHHSHPLHVSLDVDSLDESVIGGTGTPSRFGLTGREIVLLMRNLHNLSSFKHLDVAEVNTSIQTDRPYVHYHGDNSDINTKSVTVYNTCEFVHYAMGKTHWELTPRTN